MMKHLNLLLVLIPGMFAMGCGGGGDFPTVPVTGTVTCDGLPVKGAMVYFEPIKQGEQALVGKQGFSWTDDQGKFEISTYDPGAGDGAVVGKHRVRVGKGESNCDCYMNEEMDLMQVEVKRGEDNVFELVLPKKTGKEPKPLMDDEDEEN